jgi:hypothetical protein
MALSLLSFVLLTVPTLAVRNSNVVIIGGGGAGANFAVSVKDAGYSFTLLELESELGGHCSTKPRVPPVGDVGHIELGVAYLHNTTRNNERGFFNVQPYTVDLVEYVSRFTEVVPAPPFGLKTGSYTEDTEHGQGAFLNPSIPFDILSDTVTSVANYLKVQYPELEDANNPNVIRDILRLSVPDFFQADPFLGALSAFFTGSAQASDFLPYGSVSAYHILKNLPGSFLMNTIEEGWMFTMKRGCGELYQNITRYLQADDENNVILNADTFKVTRPHGQGNGKVTVHYRDSNGAVQHVIGDYVVVAIPPTLANMQKIGLKLEKEEEDVFKSMQVVPGYYGFSCNAQQNFSSLSNVNLQDSLGELDVELAPVPFVLCDFGNASMCNGFSLSVEPLNQTDMTDRISQQFEIQTLLPTPVNLTLIEVVEHTGYFPHPAASVIQQNPGYYGDLNALQGQSKTLWIGAGPSTAATTIVIEHGHLLRQQFFPDQEGRRVLPRTWSKPDFSKAAFGWPRQ